ncbi:MAG TPA: tripartite tricarboxylate transporter substrate binding protein [Burkholderiales bacterium]|jgi:tripartite-type tricarboxylate transporter receptor subunit TctC|nr:tripartite tricarboxylate transporter substrate binding protein [Burkholderiales bacterium]
MIRLFSALLGFALSFAALAQNYPSRPVKIIVPFGPGGTADTLGRLVAGKLSEQLKESFVIENKGGAGGVVGSELVAKSPADGYTLVVSGIASHVIAPLLPGGTPYDPLKDFTHIALFGGPPAVFAVNPNVPAKTLKEFVQLAKEKPGSLSYGSPGPGTQGQLVAELFKREAGIEVLHVPYKGAAAAVTDLMGGQITAVSTTLSTASGQIKAGRARALALSSAQRLPDYPDIPTFVEQGFPNIIGTVWFSLSGPPGLPQEIVDKLNAEVRRALELSDVREKLRHEGIVPNRLDAKEFTAFVTDELRRWGPTVRASGAKKD